MPQNRMILTIDELIALRQAITCRMNELSAAEPAIAEARTEKERQLTVLGCALVKFDDMIKDEQYEIKRLPF